jgi:hypothetical protein
MTTEKIIPLTIGLPKSYRDLLRRMALEESMKNPDRMVTPSKIGREIICKYLNEIMEEKKGAPSNGKTFDNQ